MVYQLGDIFIGDFPTLQPFGTKPDVYSARYSIRGHNGIDFATPSMTPVLATADGWVLEEGFDQGGYGRYIKIVHDGFLSLYAHLNDVTIKKDESIAAGQLIGHSNGTGNIDSPRLHFGIAPCDITGNKTELDNGFSGYIDPMSPTLCEWTIKHLEQPAPAKDIQVSQPSIPVTPKDYSISHTKETAYNIIAQYLIHNGLNEFLTLNNELPIEPNKTPEDALAADRILKFLDQLFEELLNTDSVQGKTPEPDNNINSGQTISPPVVKSEISQETPQEEAKRIIATATPVTSFFKRAYSAIRGFIFV